MGILLETSWLGPAIWAALYVSDYAFTIRCARLYQAQSYVAFEGSYEITPMFQADIDALRTVSPRFIAALVGTTAYMWIVRTLVGAEAPGIYSGVLGALILMQLTIHTRHLRNWFMFRHCAGNLEGRLTYRRDFMLRSSSFELLLFSGLYFILFLATGSPFVLGGSLSCAVLAINHRRLASRHKVALSTVTQ